MRAITSSLLAGLIALGATAPAFADNNKNKNRYDNSRYERDYRDNDRRGDRDWNDRRDYDRNWNNNRGRNDRYNGRGWYDSRGNHRDWRQGDRFDRYSYTRFYVVNDYRNYRDHRGYRLPPPRYGERYYRNNDTGEILLIAAATGLVLWALNN
jgi:Ni/Co efflux regulator RcnB